MTLVQSTAEKIKTKGYWAVTVRPAEFQETRIRRDRLFQLVHDTAVSLNGRIIPSVDGEPDSLVNGPDWIEFSSEWGLDLQSWRFYQSGQFVLLLAVATDWEEPPVLDQIPHPTVRTMPLWDSLAIFAAIYEFAARLSLTEAGSDLMVVSTMIKNLQGVQLIQDNHQKTSLRHYIFRDDVFAYPPGKPLPIERARLVGDSRTMAAQAGSDLLRTFGFDSTTESVARMQAEF